jgi:hypothetical protein
VSTQQKPVSTYTSEAALRDEAIRIARYACNGDEGRVFGVKRPAPGDILYLSTPEHVAVLDELDESAGRLGLYEYGQWNAKAGKASGRRRETTFAGKGRSLKVGTRTLHGWLSLARLPGLVVAEASKEGSFRELKPKALRD